MAYGESSVAMMDQIRGDHALQSNAACSHIFMRATVLQGYSRDVVAADNTNAIVSITSQALAALFQVPVVVMLVTEGRVIFPSSKSAT